MTPPYFLCWSFIILLGLLIYGQAFQFDFVFDDHLFIINNPYIKDFNHVPLIWHRFPMTRALGFYSFAFNYALGRLNPMGYHIFNFMVHLCGVGLAWALAGLLFKITKTPDGPCTTLGAGRVSCTQRGAGFIIAVLFLVHPCQTQAVSYISQRFESMAAVFYLGAVYCYLRARVSAMHHVGCMARGPHPTWCGGWFGLSILSTILGIFTKETILTVPLMLLASEWILFPKFKFCEAKFKWLFSAAGEKKFYILLILAGILLYLLSTRLLHVDLSVFLQSVPSQSHDGDILTPGRYFLTQMRVFLTFLRLLALPVNQNLDYDYPASTGLLFPPLTLVGLCTIVGMILMIVKLRRKYPLITFGLAWVLITFSINLAPRSNVIFEHKLYLISFGFFLAMVVLLSKLVRDRRALTLILACVIALWSWAGWERNKVWKNDYMLWSDTIQKSPRKARVYNNRGYTCALRGELTGAIADFTKAIEISPTFADAYYNRGNAWSARGRLDQAIRDYSKAIETAPGRAKGAYYNRGGIYDKQGRLAGAILDYTKVIEIDPGYAPGYYNRGIDHAKEGRLTQAMSDFNQAIRINPRYAQAYNNRGFIYATQGNRAQAIADFNQAIQIDPNYTEASKNKKIAETLK